MNNSFKELNDDELLSIDGGELLIGIAVGVILYYGTNVANEIVERKTGHSIGDHMTNAAGKAIDAVGSGLEKIGDFISGN